ncbi:MAG: DUF58 domain-containing protein [Candidatus Acidiferrales bacterium]
MAPELALRWWRSLDRPGWRSFGIAMVALALALVLAIYSGAAAESGRLWLAACAALSALGVAGWVAFTIVPVLARRTPLRWLAYHIDYKFTRTGAIYIGGVMVVALAALNTGNNLLFMVLACLLAGILISGVASQTVLSGVDLHLELPEHIFAGQPVLALAELRNHKFWLPSFSLSIVGEEPATRKQSRVKEKKDPAAPAAILTQPVFFPYVPRADSVEQSVELSFPRRGVYKQEALGLRTGFPFGFLRKTRRVSSDLEIIVYPSVKPAGEFYELLPLVSGELESFLRGRGNDLYAIRDYHPTDSARHVDWKATAKTGALQVREFAREDERRLLIALDPEVDFAHFPDPAELAERFERAVGVCASLAWHFYEFNSVLEFRTIGTTLPAAPAEDNIYAALRALAKVEPHGKTSGPSYLSELSQLTGIFKIIVTFQPRGAIPTNLWSSSFLLFQ